MATAYIMAIDTPAWEPPAGPAALYPELRGRYSREEEATYYRHKDLAQHGGIWFYKGDWVTIPKACPDAKLLVIKMFHDNPSAGHCSAQTTYDKIAKTFYWANQRREIADYVKRCQRCGSVKARNHLPLGTAHLLPVPEALFSSVAIDWLDGNWP